jgi:hypothetical protein
MLQCKKFDLNIVKETESENKPLKWFDRQHRIIWSKAFSPRPFSILKILQFKKFDLNIVKKTESENKPL